MSLKQSLLMTCLVLTLAGVGLGCSESPTVPQHLTGPYYSTSWVAPVDGVLTDIIAAGGWIQLTLNADASTSGTANGPGAGEDGEDLLVSMAGSWRADATTVTVWISGVPFLNPGVLTSGVNSLEYRDEETGHRITLSVTPENDR